MRGVETKDDDDGDRRRRQGAESVGGGGGEALLFGGVFGGRGEFNSDVNHAVSSMNARQDGRTNSQSQTRLATNPQTKRTLPCLYA